MEMIELLRQLCTIPGAPGRESPAAAVAKELLAPLGQVETTGLGSVLCRMHPWQEGRETVLLEAHLDQISLVVASLCEEGFLRVGGCGGIDARLLPAAYFQIHTKEGAIPAIGVSTPPHLQRAEDKDKSVKVEDILLDTGLSTEEAKRLITPGDVITFDAPAASLAQGLFCCGALDDRAGCVSVIAAGQLLAGSDWGVNVALLLSTMEEVGGHGAKTSAYALNPDCAIAVDVTFGQAPGVPEHKSFKLGSGAQIGMSPILSRAMVQRLSDLAQQHNLPYGYEVMGGNTGTDADQLTICRCGVPTALISIPLRNMHTPGEIVDCKDVETTAALMAEFVKDYVCQKGGAVC